MTRTTKFDFDSMPPTVTWFRDAVLPSVLLSAAGIAFPCLERLMIAELEASPLVDHENSELVRAFRGHELRHAAAHDRSLSAIRNSGFRIDALTTTAQAFEKVAGRWLLPGIRRINPRITLGMFAGFEHWTTELALICVDRGARIVLRSPDRTEALNDLEVLFLWHGLEEIEHRSVVYDMFEAADGTLNERRATFVAATGALGAFMAVSSLVLGIQTPRLLGATEWRRRGSWCARLSRHRVEAIEVAADAFRRYWRPDFHPSERGLAFEQSLLKAVIPRDQVRVVQPKRQVST